MPFGAGGVDVIQEVDGRGGESGLEFTAVFIIAN
jgi:hypothetical protein